MRQILVDHARRHRSQPTQFVVDDRNQQMEGLAVAVLRIP
jgi:hypothetical protein